MPGVSLISVYLQPFELPLPPGCVPYYLRNHGEPFKGPLAKGSRLAVDPSASADLLVGPMENHPCSQKVNESPKIPESRVRLEAAKRGNRGKPATGMEIKALASVSNSAFVSTQRFASA